MRSCLMRMSVLLIMVVWWLAAGSVPAALGQNSSLFRRAAADYGSDASGQSGSPDQDRAMQGRYPSLFAVEPLPKRIIRVGDLVTVIVRQKSSYKHSGKSDQERELEIKAELKDWPRLKGWRLIPSTPPEGDPKIDLQLGRSFDGEGKKNRTDEVVTRVTVKVIDVLPNGCLVLQGGPDVIETDGEKQVVTLTGACRSEDIAPDNTILSTQLLECKFRRTSSGAVRDSMRRGWVYKMLDSLRPF